MILSATRHLVHWRNAATRARLFGRSGVALALLVGILGIQAVQSTPAGAIPDVATWSEASPSTVPPALVDPSMAFDGATDQMIMIGATSADASLETWEWTGTDWIRESPVTSPPPMSGASLAYDGSTSQLVLFGGESLDGSTVYGDTWLWDGTDWTKVNYASATPPAARYGASLAYDSAHTQLILYGGSDSDGNLFNDTWNWDGSQWTDLSSASPPDAARYFAATAYDQDTGQLIVFSGSGYADTDEWDGSNWNQISPEYTPGSASGAVMAYDGATFQTIYFGGMASEGYARNGTFDWNGSYFQSLSPPNSPEGLAYSAMAYDPDTGQMVLFGGNGGSNNGNANVTDTWIYGPPAPDSTCTPFTDNFQEGSLSENWETNTPLVSSVASDDDATYEQPELQFSDSGMDMQGAAGENEFTGIQSVTACSGPFSFETDVEGLQSYGNSFVIDLVSADQSEAMSVGGELDSEDSPFYGIYASDTLDAGYNQPGSSDIFSSPATDTVYDVTLSVDQNGNGSVTLNGPDFESPITTQIGSIGTGPFYVVLGQSEQQMEGSEPNEALWSGADLATNTGISASLSTSSPTVNGVETVPASALSTSSVTDSTGSGSGDAASAPLSSIPLSSIGLASSPLSSIPLSSIPLSSIGFPGSGSASGIEEAAQALDDTLLSSLSITYPAGCSPSTTQCTGWEGVLEDTPYENVPLESVTLGDVLGNATAAANLDTVDLGDLDLASSPLSSIPLSSIELGSTPLSSIGLNGSDPGSAALAAWCGTLSNDFNIQCSEFGFSSSDSTTDATLLSLALAGVPLSSIPLSSIPLSSIDLGSSPLSSIPLSSIDLASNPLSSIPLSSIPLSSIPLSSIPLSSIGDLSDVVDCNTYPDCADGTLGEAYDAGAILPTATLGELGTYGDTTIGELLDGDDTGASGYPNLTLGDLILSTIPPASYQWQAVNLQTVPLAQDESSGGTVTYTVTMDVTNSLADPTVTVDLPSSFSYVAGSSQLDGVSTSDPTTGSDLEWDLPTLADGTHTLTFDANAGIGLGPASAAVTVAAGSNSSTATASVDVVNGEEPDIDSASTALDLTPGVLDSSQTSQGNLNIGYITGPGDLNDWSVNVPQGAELSLAMSNLPETYDLELFGPGSQQLQGTPTQNIGGVTDTVPSLDPSQTSEATPGSQDLATTPPSGDVLEAVSNNPDAQSQYIQTTPLQAGTYIIQVSGYNGAYSTQPYLLQANVIGGETEPSCPGGISYLSSLGSPASGPVSVPNGTNTLFLVDTQRLTAAFGQSDEQQIMADVEAAASDSSAGVVGAIVPVDSYTSVQNAYASWNSNPCSVDAANGVVQAIASVVDQIRSSNSSIQNLVIVGADDQIPFARVSDGTTESNERDYGQSTFAGENNPEADALSLGYYMSDDPYASNSPLGVGSATLYLPQLAVGRLVESASEIEGSLTRFVSTDGDLDASASLTTGYSFLTSGAEAVSANLQADGLTPTTLINENWQESDLDAALASDPTPGVDSINAHFDYSRALPAYDNTNGTETNLFTTEDVRDPPDSTSYSGRLLFSMGCHSGLDIDDAEVSTSGVTTPVDDWAKTFADEGALWVANTGYGYADTDSIAYSAKLMAEFAGNLNGSMTIGEALSEAKQQYAAGQPILSPYDLKALMESTLYGLPMYRLNSLGTPTAPPNGPATQVDSATGLQSAQVSVNLGKGSGAGQLGLVSTTNGSYYQVNATGTNVPGTQATEFRPIEPAVAIPVNEPNLVAHGALITSLKSTDTKNFKPTYSVPAVGSSDDTQSTIGDAAFPGTLQRVSSYSTFTSTGTGQAANLDLVVGQYFPNPTSSGTGTQRIFNAASATVFYQSPGSALATDYAQPTIDSSTGTAGLQTANFDAQVTPSSSNDPVLEVVVLYTDAANPGTWTETTLTTSDGGSTWSGSGPGTQSGEIQYIVEAVDAAGNVAVSNDEGNDFNGSTQPAVSITLSGGPTVNGYYTGSVTADITAPSGSTYSLDGSAPASAPSQITVSQPGVHSLTVMDQSGDSQTVTFSISSSQTTTILTPSSDPVTINEPLELYATIDPATQGVGTPTGSVEFLDAGSPMADCNGTSGESLDSAGVATCFLDYSDVGSHQITATYSGDNSFETSSSGPLTLDVTAYGTTTKLTTSANPLLAGKSATFTAKVTSPTFGKEKPSGRVEFLEGNSPVDSCGASDGVKLSTNGTASCTISFRATGGFNISAIYLGSGAFVSSGSQTVSEIATKSTCKAFLDCNLSGLDLAGVNLAGVNLGCTNLAGADLQGAILTGAIINEADLRKANLSGASAAGVNLSESDLKDADLSYANFTDANLKEADLVGADTTGTNFTGAKLKGATR